MKKIIIVIIAIVLASALAWLLLPVFVNKEVNEELPGVNQGLNQDGEDGKDLNQNVQDEKDRQDLNKVNNGNQTEKENQPKILSQGEFIGQSNHRAAGTVKIIKIDGKNYVRFEENFDAENGPDLFVHLGKDGAYDPKINLGKLKGNLGSQNYEIPNEIDLEDYNEVWIWCRAFSVPFAKAEMK
jgi:hypothetical protein